MAYPLTARLHRPRAASGTLRAVLRRAARLVSVIALLSMSTSAHAFPHVVKKGETLAQIAERTYGKVEMEQLLVAANGLDAGGGIPIVPGLRLEVPALGYHRVTAGETWAGLA